MNLLALDQNFTEICTRWNLLPDMVLVVNMMIGLFLGFVFGYERSYHGRAAGMRTYGLVCMVAAALTSLSATPGDWFGGHVAINTAIVDPTRTIQGIVTGIGFLGAGIIMKDGFRISGLTTAASIWASAAIGVLVGLEYYLASVIMTVVAELFVLLGARFDTFLPSRRPIFVLLQFKEGVPLREEQIRALTRENGYEVAKNSISIGSRAGQTEWRFVAIAINKRQEVPLSKLAEAMEAVEGLESFHLSRARN